MHSRTEREMLDGYIARQPILTKRRCELDLIEHSELAERLIHLRALAALAFHRHAVSRNLKGRQRHTRRQSDSDRRDHAARARCSSLAVAQRRCGIQSILQFRTFCHRIAHTCRNIGPLPLYGCELDIHAMALERKANENGGCGFPPPPNRHTEPPPLFSSPLPPPPARAGRPA